MSRARSGITEDDALAVADDIDWLDPALAVCVWGRMLGGRMRIVHVEHTDLPPYDPEWGWGD